jgi:hypothetical protein
MALQEKIAEATALRQSLEETRNVYAERSRAHAEEIKRLHAKVWIFYMVYKQPVNLVRSKTWNRVVPTKR